MATRSRSTSPERNSGTRRRTFSVTATGNGGRDDAQRLLVAGLTQRVDDLTGMVRSLVNVQQAMMYQQQQQQAPVQATGGPIDLDLGGCAGFPPGFQQTGPNQDPVVNQVYQQMPVFPGAPPAFGPTGSPGVQRSPSPPIHAGVPLLTPDQQEDGFRSGFFDAGIPLVAPSLPNMPTGNSPSSGRRPMEIDSGGYQLNRAEKWVNPIEKPKKWSTRSEEIVGFSHYLTYLQSWLGNMSDKFPKEIYLAVRHPTQITQESLNHGESLRSKRLQSLLMQVFSDQAKSMNILLAYSESCIVDAICGYESLRLLGREFSLYSRAEGWSFRQKFITRSFKESTVTESFTVFDLEMARYMRLIQSLRNSAGIDSLVIHDSDKVVIMLKSIPERCREYALAGRGQLPEDWHRALEWEHKHRIWMELDTSKSHHLKPMTEEKGKGKGGKGKGNKGKDGKGKNGKSKENKCFLCGNAGHYAKECPDSDKVAKQEQSICYKCGGKGHFASRCPTKNGKQQSGKGSGEKSSGKGGKGKKGKGGKKGNEILEDGTEQAAADSAANEEQASGSVDNAAGGQSMSLLFMSFMGQNSLQDFNMQQFWLLDSGASAHVVRESDLHLFKVIRSYSINAKFSAAQGHSVVMTRKVRLQIYFQFWVINGSLVSEEQWMPVTLDAFVADVQSNVLSVGTLAEKGWHFQLSSDSALLFHGSIGNSTLGDISWFANCPWLRSWSEGQSSEPKNVRFAGVDDVEMQGDSLQVSEISQQSKFCEHVLQPVIQQGSDEAALHVMRGHQPPDPRHCIICSRAHGISKPFRRSKPQLFQVQADFNDIKFNRFSQKYLVMVHSETGCLGFAAIGPDQNRTVAAIKDFLIYLGLVGHGPNVEILTDAEFHVSKLIKQVNAEGRHLVCQRAAPQEHQTIGHAERSVRKLKECMKTIELQLEMDGFDIVSSQFSAQMISNCFASTHNRFGVTSAGSSPKEELFDKTMDGSDSASFAHQVLGEVPESLGRVERWINCMYLHGQCNGQLGHLCGCVVDGQERTFVAKHIKLIVPSKVSDTIFPGVVTPLSDVPLPKPNDPLDDDEKKDVSEAGPASVPASSYDGKSNPPISFYREHGFSSNCLACEKGVKGRIHSTSCRKRYADWLKSQHASIVPDIALNESEGVRIDNDAEGQGYSPSIAPADAAESSEMPVLVLPSGGEPEVDVDLVDAMDLERDEPNLRKRNREESESMELGSILQSLNQESHQCF